MDSELKRALEDISVIRTSLTHKEKVFPGRAWMLLTGSGAVLLGTLLNWLLPRARADHWFALLWIWTPIALTVAVFILATFHRFKARGTMVVGLFAKELFWVRLVVGPATLSLALMGMAGGFFPPAVALVALSVIAAMVSMVLPRSALAVPAVYLVTGITQILLAQKSELMGLADGILVALGFFAAAMLARKQEGAGRA